MPQAQLRRNRRLRAPRMPTGPRIGGDPKRGEEAHVEDELA